MKYGCGCSLIINEPFEFKIIDKPQLECNYCVLLPNTMDEDWNKLQLKIICDFTKVIKQLECGIQPDIELILEEISLIYMNNCNYGVTKRVMVTDPEEDNFLRRLSYLSEFSTLEEKNLVLLNLGIYDTLLNIVTKNELGNTILNTKNQIDERVDSEVQIINERINSEVQTINTTINNNDNNLNNHISELNNLLNTKIGFVWKVQHEYFGFTDENSKNQWISNGGNSNSSLILAKWVASDWVPDIYTVTFNTMGGNPVNSLNITEGYSIILPTPTWIDDSKVFDGWYTNSDYTGTKYNSGQKIVPSENIVFYAKWKNAASATLTMYSFDVAQPDNFTNSDVITILNKNTDTTVLNRLKYHYIPTSVLITVTKKEYGEYGIETVVIGSYDSINNVYKIENMNLIDENIKYN